MRGSRFLAGASALLVLATASCSSDGRSGDRARARATSSSALAIPPSSPAPGPTTPPPVEPTVPPAPPAYSATASPVTEADLPSTYRAGCPVVPDALRMIEMTHWGFDDAPHVGRMVVSAAVADQVIQVFRRLYDARFPVRQIRPVDEFGGSDPESMAADNTSGFNCRDAVADGPARWSVHAYGEAIDVNPVENPYVQGGAVQPAAGSAFVDRTNARAGMSGPDTVLNQAFASVGWQWGGRWSTPDYQHFSATGG